MTKSLEAYLHSLGKVEAAPEPALVAVAMALGIPLDLNCLDFWRFSDGAGGSIGVSYLVIWPIEELVERNERLCVDEFLPGLVLFGTDGGNEAFGFDLRSNFHDEVSFVQVPLVGMHLEAVRQVSSSPLGFLKALESGKE